MCFPGLWVSLFPGRFPSSWAPLSRFSYSTASSSVVLAVASGSCLLLLWGASSYSLSRLIAYFCFLGRLFRKFSWFQGFLSYFSDLLFYRSQSCLGLLWFLVFLSIQLLGFSVTSSHCGVSHFLTWSLFLSVPRFCTWMVRPPSS